MVRIIPKQSPDGMWVAYDTVDEMAFAKSIWFENGYEDKRDCEIAIHEYLEFGCTSDYSDHMV